MAALGFAAALALGYRLCVSRGTLYRKIDAALSCLPTTFKKEYGMAA